MQHEVKRCINCGGNLPKDMQNVRVYYDDDNNEKTFCPTCRDKWLAGELDDELFEVYTTKKENETLAQIAKQEDVDLKKLVDLNKDRYEGILLCYVFVLIYRLVSKMDSSGIKAGSKLKAKTVLLLPNVKKLCHPCDEEGPVVDCGICKGEMHIKCTGLAAEYFAGSKQWYCKHCELKAKLQANQQERKRKRTQRTPSPPSPYKESPRKVYESIIAVGNEGQAMDTQQLWFDARIEEISHTAFLEERARVRFLGWGKK